MGKTKNDKLKYIVIKCNWLDRLSVEQLDHLEDILKTINNQNSYYLCNTDEPYAEEVLQTIIRGEARKEDFEGVNTEVLKSELSKIKNKQISVEDILANISKKGLK